MRVKVGAMKAVVFEGHGGIEKLQYKDVPDPKPSSGEVLIRVKAAGCNFNDIWARRGLPGMKVSLPHISGSDVSGIVAEVGSTVSGINIGDEVVIHPGVSCRKCEFCVSAREYFCRNYKIYGFQTGPLDGGDAEYVKVPEVNVLPKPKNLSFEEAASFPLVLLTVWHMLVTRARMRAGNDVLIWGAAGGLGTIAVQVAKLFGAKAIACVGSEDKAEAVKKIGASEVVNHAKQDVVSEVRRITNRRGVNIVFEHTGAATWERSVQSLAWGGTIVVCGATSGFDAKTDLRFLWNKQLNFLGCHMGTKSELIEALRFVESGLIRPVIHTVLPLEKAAVAQQTMEECQAIGKIILTP